MGVFVTQTTNNYCVLVNVYRRFIEICFFQHQDSYKTSLRSIRLCAVTSHNPTTSSLCQLHLAHTQAFFHVAAQVEWHSQMAPLVINFRQLTFQLVKTYECISCNNGWNIKLRPFYVPCIQAYSKFVRFVNMTWPNIKRKGGMRWNEQFTLLTFHAQRRAVCISVDTCT
jgi:hypothetical protein